LVDFGRDKGGTIGLERGSLLAFLGEAVSGKRYKALAWRSQIVLATSLSAFLVPMRFIVGTRKAGWWTSSLEQTDSFSPIEGSAKPVTNVFLFGARLCTLLSL